MTGGFVTCMTCALWHAILVNGDRHVNFLACMQDAKHLSHPHFPLKVAVRALVVLHMTAHSFTHSPVSLSLACLAGWFIKYIVYIIMINL